MAVHEHKHGVLPSEYDIRDIDEELYLQLLKNAIEYLIKKIYISFFTIIKKYFN